VSDVLLGRTSGKSIVIVSSPVTDAKGRFRGLVFGSMRLDTLLEQLRITQLENGANVFLAKADGTLLSGAVAWKNGAAAGQRHLRKGDVLYDHALNRTVPDGVYRNVGGERVVGTYTWVFDGRWLLAGETTEHNILALHASILGIPLLGATVLFLIFGPMTIRLVRSLEAPIRRLVEHSGRIEGGDFDFNCEPEHKPHDPEEIRSLNAAYCLMVERVQGAMEELRRASLMDVLTGAPNRKSMLQEGPRLIESTARAGRPVSLLMIDLDHFKGVNDTYGHATGDTVLRAFTRELGFRVRGSDIFARMGGEEFAVLAPNASFKDALELGERIRRHVEALRILTEDGELKVTVSIGVATLSSGSRMPRALDALMASADKAMYEAKNEGRNRVAGASVEL
jgi:diguanylate cyclase (GGDEF)-like protein